MSLDLKRLSRYSERLEMFIRQDAYLHTQFLEVMELRERLREAELSAVLQNATRTRELAPVVIAAAAWRARLVADGYGGS